MTDADKLEALVRKAKIASNKDFELMAGVTVANAVRDYCDWLIQTESTALFLFNKQVAKALFGNKKIEVFGGLWTKGVLKPTTIELYQIDAFLYHLQQAVIADDRIGYMYGAVFGE